MIVAKMTPESDILDFEVRQLPCYLAGMLRYLFLITCGLFFYSGHGQAVQLSPQAEIRVVTCGPGQNELYSAFGHSAYRVSDPAQGIEFIYNYGVFDFDQPYFYLNFARGHLNYKLSRHEYSRFRDYYIYMDRFIHEQILNLNMEEKQQLFEFLEWNNLPENQYYFYDYFYDNCATRIRDALTTVFGDKIAFDGSYITHKKSIRDLTDDYLQYQPWGDLGIDICLGLPMDIEATPYVHMFLPDYIESGFNHATLNRDGEILPLVRDVEIIYSSTETAIAKPFLTPTLVFWAVFAAILMITFFDYRNQRITKPLDLILFTVLGLLGLLLFLLWTVTDHRAAADNLNVLWAFPLHLAGVVFLWRRKNKLIVKYFGFYTLLGSLTILGWFFLPQHLHPALFPLALGALLRSVFIYRHYKVSEA